MKIKIICFQLKCYNNEHVWLNNVIWRKWTTSTRLKSNLVIRDSFYYIHLLYFSPTNCAWRLLTSVRNTQHQLRENVLHLLLKVLFFREVSSHCRHLSSCADRWDLGKEDGCSVQLHGAGRVTKQRRNWMPLLSTLPSWRHERKSSWSRHRHSELKWKKNNGIHYNYQTSLSNMNGNHTSKLTKRHHEAQNLKLHITRTLQQ